MRDFPMFTTENGIVNLVLREIPYRKKSYIKILDSCEPVKLLEECRDFCRAVGAEEIYASGHNCLEVYPVYATILEMECDRKKLIHIDAVAEPVARASAEEWKNIYNTRMKAVPNASYMDDAAIKQMLQDGSGYYIYEQQHVIGIGKVENNRLEALASVVPGKGEAVVCALAKTVSDEMIILRVAEENTPAMRLYQRLGFVVKEQISKWYKIL